MFLMLLITLILFISELAGSWKVCLAVVGSSRCKNSKVSDRGVGWLVGWLVFDDSSPKVNSVMPY